MTNHSLGGTNMHARRGAGGSLVGGSVVGSWVASALAVAAVLVPKCPLCLAAYLCLLGVGAGSARAVVALGVPICLGLIGFSAFATIAYVARRNRRSRRAPPSACALERAQRSCCARSS